MDTINNIESLKNFFSGSNTLHVWRSKASTSIKFVIDDHMIDVHMIDNIVFTVDGVDTVEEEEVVCKVSYLIVSVFPSHFEYDPINHNYSLL